jgi:hypothetical protein
MRKEKIFVILGVIIITNSTSIGAITIRQKLYFQSEEYESLDFIQLKDDELQKLSLFLASIKDLETRKKVQKILKLIITDDGKLNIETVEKLSLEYYKIVSEKIYTNASISTCKQDVSFDDYEITYQKTVVSLGTSTVFTAPYSSCFSWGDATPGVDEYSHGCNKESGSIGAYTNSFIGGATAEAMQQLNLYIGRTKIIKVDAEIIRTGGKATFGFAAFAGTEKSWSWDDFQSNYHREDVDPWWNWSDITYKIISLVTILIGYNPTSVSQAIMLLAQLINFKALATQMDDMLDNDDAEIIHIQFNISLSPGWHYIWIGLRATSSACLTGTGSAVTMGQLSQITIDGIAAPSKPNVNGPSSGKTGSYTFSFVSNDPNNDKIQYKVDWGDGKNTEYTDFYNSGEIAYKTHNYDKKGTYTINVKAIDIDKMESHDCGTHTIKISSEKNFFPSFWKIHPKNTVFLLLKFLEKFSILKTFYLEI